jgi:hypothetical protein
MIRRVILAVVVAVVVTLGCILLGMLLGAINISVAAVIGGFLTKYAAAIGILAGLWHFFRGS